MKDEKPRNGEEIIFCYSKDNPLVSIGFYEEYMGEVYNEYIGENISIISVKISLDKPYTRTTHWSTIELKFETDKLKWRKICKLPDK